MSGAAGYGYRKLVDDVVVGRAVGPPLGTGSGNELQNVGHVGFDQGGVGLFSVALEIDEIAQVGAFHQDGADAGGGGVGQGFPVKVEAAGALLSDNDVFNGSLPVASENLGFDLSFLRRLAHSI